MTQLEKIRIKNIIKDLQADIDEKLYEIECSKKQLNYYKQMLKDEIERN